MASKGIAIGLTAAKWLFNRGKTTDNTATMGNDKKVKEKWPKLRKLRIALSIPIVVSCIATLLIFLMIFAGSKPGFMTNYAVFTLNTSDIGEGIYHKIDGLISDWNVDALHIDLKRSVPVDNPSVITAAPTTLITMAPRDVKSVLESLTDNAGDGIESVNSAAHSKASQVKSKASSAANAAESSVNGGLDKAADEIKGKLTELVDNGFKNVRTELDLPGFTKIFMRTTCTGSYETGDGKHAKPHAKIDKCSKDSPINPMVFVQLFYWASAIHTVGGILFGLKVIHKPGNKKWINWTLFFLAGGAFLLAVGSALAQGIANSAQRLANFLGGPLTISGAAGHPFLRTSWAMALMLLVNTGVYGWFKWYIKRHPGQKRSSKSSSICARSYDISAPMAQRPEVQYPATAYRQKDADIRDNDIDSYYANSSEHGKAF